MAIITVGAGAANYDSYSGSAYTYVDTGYGASGTGIIDTIELWYTVANGAGVKVGTWYFVSDVGGTKTYTNRDYEDIGSVTKDSKQTFTGLNCDVETDDVLGVYHTGGGLEHNSSGGEGGRLYALGNKFGGNIASSSFNNGIKMAMYGTGYTIQMLPPT